MTDRSFKSYQGEPRSPEYDITDEVIWEETKLAGQAYNGESTVSEIVIRDSDGQMGPFEMPVTLGARNQIEAKLGSNFLFRGRWIGRTWSRLIELNDRARVVKGQAEDVNSELRGILVDGWARPAETDIARVQGLVAAFLSGSPRATTFLNGSNWVSSSNAVMLPERTTNPYTQTDPYGVLLDIAATSAKQFFVTIDHELFYDGFDSTNYTCPYYITDDIAELAADPTHALSIVPDVGDLFAIDGQQFLSGVRVHYGSGADQSVYRNNPTREALKAHWEEAVSAPPEITDATAAIAYAFAVLGERSQDGRTFTLSVRKADGTPIPDEMVGSIKPGMLIGIKSRVNPIGLHTTTMVRIVNRTLLSPSPGQWIVQLKLAKPERTYGKGFPRGPNAPKPGVPGTQTPPTVDRSWSFTSDLFDDQEGFHDWEGASIYLGPGARWAWTGTASVNVYYTTSPAGNRADPATDYQVEVHVTSRSGSGTRQFSIVWLDTANGVLRTDVLHANLPAGNHIFSPPTTPAGTAGFRLLCTSSGTVDLVVSYVALTHGGGVDTPGVPNDGNPDLVGTPGIYAPIDHSHSIHSTDAPDSSDDETQGIPVKTTWIQLDDLTNPTQILGVWVLADNSEGAAIWLPWPGDDGSGSSVPTLQAVSTMHRFPLIGHRGDIGSADSLPENTLESVRQVALKGGQGCEIDVRLSSAGTPYLMHDATVDRTTDGSGAISGLSDATIDGLTVDAGFGYISGSYSVPTLASVFDALNPYDFVLYIQLSASSDANATALAQLVVAEGWTHRAIIEVSTLTEAAAVKAVSSSLTTMVNNVVSGADADTNVDWLSMEHDTVTSLAVATGKAPQHIKSYISIADFPADETAIIQNMWDFGVSAYQTDNLDFALAAQRALLYGGGAGASALDDLTDVTITAPAEGDMLRHDGSGWVNSALRWEPVTTNPGTGPELVWDGDEIVMTWADYS